MARLAQPDHKQRVVVVGMMALKPRFPPTSLARFWLHNHAGVRGPLGAELCQGALGEPSAPRLRHFASGRATMRQRGSRTVMGPNVLKTMETVATHITLRARLALPEVAIAHRGVTVELVGGFGRLALEAPLRDGSYAIHANPVASSGSTQLNGMASSVSSPAGPCPFPESVGRSLTRV